MRYRKEKVAGYKEAADYVVNTLRLQSGLSDRGDCPLCGGRNTFSATNVLGKISFYCFRASCKVSGIIKKDLTLDDARTTIKKEIIKTPEPLEVNETIGWESDITKFPYAIDYLKINNCFETYEANPRLFFYDTIQERLVFCSYETNNSFNLATGRSLIGRKPKWYKYVALPGAVFCVAGNIRPETVYIAEDCASACSLSRLGGWGLALTGTRYDIQTLVDRTKEFKHVVICLDKDAQHVSLDLQRDLKGASSFHSVRIATLSDDAKYLSKEKLTKEIENVKNKN